MVKCLKVPVKSNLKDWKWQSKIYGIMPYQILIYANKF